jgi:MerR family transcriptional regulator, light-induced transcriptional regulator
MMLTSQNELLNNSSPAPLPSTALMRSGTAARLAGLPAATLRIWERRYGVVTAPKTAGGQRLYSRHDVQRLRLLRQLTDSGHSISTIATLELGSLIALSTDLPPAVANKSRIVAIGQGMAQTLNAVTRYELVAVFDDLDHAQAQADATQAADMLLVHLPSLQPGTTKRLLALQTKLQAAAVTVLYAFGPQAEVDFLRASGVSLYREPATSRNITRLLDIALATRAGSVLTASRYAPRRFSDEALAHFAGISTSVACECPRHVAEIVMHLTSFETYSADCISRSANDAELHRYLNDITATARTLFEQAIERIALEEDLDIPHAINLHSNQM